MSSSIKKNIGLQTIYQVLNTCLPLITAPYLARVLGAAKLGIFSFTSSVAAYFTLAAMLGTVNYGTRSIAGVKEDIEKRSQIFWEIFSLQLIASFLAAGAYLLYLIFACQENQLIAALQLIAIASCCIDINWLFFGMENFKTTVTRNAMIRILTVTAILLFVKKPTDLWIYTLFMLGSSFFSQLALWCYVPKMIRRSQITWRGVLRHIKPNLILFVPLLAMSVYHTMDKTMLGLLSNYEQSGFYYNADKIVNIPLAVILGIGTVMLPRMSALIQAGRKTEADQLFTVSMEGVVAVSCAMSFGIIAVSKEFIPFFFGEGYEECILLTVVLAPVLMIKGISDVTRTQYLVPYQKESIFTKSVFVGAAANLGMNLLLIPKLGALGAVIGTVAAELVSCLWQLKGIRKSISLKTTLRNSCVYLIIGGLMVAAVRLAARIECFVVWKLAAEVFVGVLVYGILCLVFWKVTRFKILQGFE